MAKEFVAPEYVGFLVPERRRYSKPLAEVEKNQLMP